MKKFLNNIVLFIPFSIVVYAALIFAWGDYAPEVSKKNLNYELGSVGHMYSRLQNVRRAANIDVLFLGSSLCYRGFDPRIFETRAGVSSFNLGSSSQTPLQAAVLLERYLDRLDPKLIFYQLNPAAFSGDGVESSLDLIANDRNDFESVKLALRQNHVKVYNTLVYALLRDALGKNADFREAAKRYSDTYIEGGFVEKHVKGFRKKAAGAKRRKKQRWKANEQQFDAFEKILSLAQERGIEVVLIQPPFTEWSYGAHSNRRAYEDKIGSYGKLYDFGRMEELDDQLHFYDHYHLNQAGVEIFNKKLIEAVFADRNL